MLVVVMYTVHYVHVKSLSDYRIIGFISMYASFLLEMLIDTLC